MVHRFLRSVGFSKIKTKMELQAIVKKCIRSASKKSYGTVDQNSDLLYSEYHSYVAEGIGLCIRGEYDENNKFIYDYCFPFLDGEDISSYEEISVERQTEKLSYAGVVDDYNLGISLIFYLQNIIKYLKYYNSGRFPNKLNTLSLSALSDSGTVLMPISKNQFDIEKARIYNMRKSRMVKEAAGGNENAITDLTIHDIDTINNVQKMALEEDLYSLVDTYFMPYGVECDLYAIMGEIKQVKTVTNKFTGEEIYIMRIDVNDIVFNVCVNKQDVTGEVAVGRRYKGTIWLQGNIIFPED